MLSGLAALFFKKVKTMGMRAIVGAAWCDRCDRENAVRLIAREHVTFLADTLSGLFSVITSIAIATCSAITLKSSLISVSNHTV